MTHRDPALAAWFQHHAREAVAFMDETYSVEAGHSTTFYSIAAVVVQPDQLAPLRDGLTRLVGEPYFHSTELLKSATGRADVRAVLRYLAEPEGTERSVVSVEAPISNRGTDAELARERCLGVLLRALASGATPAGSVTSFVMERRASAAQTNRDASTKARLVQDGKLPRRASLMHVSPSKEPLLWLPDAVCSAYRRQLVRGASDLFDEISHLTTVIRA